MYVLNLSTSQFYPENLNLVQHVFFGISIVHMCIKAGVCMSPPRLWEEKNTGKWKAVVTCGDGGVKQGPCRVQPSKEGTEKRRKKERNRLENVNEWFQKCFYVCFTWSSLKGFQPNQLYAVKKKNASRSDMCEFNHQNRHMQSCQRSSWSHKHFYKTSLLPQEAPLALNLDRFM